MESYSTIAWAKYDKQHTGRPSLTPLEIGFFIILTGYIANLGKTALSNERLKLHALYFEILGMTVHKPEVQKKSIEGILFKFKGEFSNQKNMQQFCHTVLKLNASNDNVF